MCSAAHGWVGLGRIVYVHSSEQLAGWLAAMSVPQPPVRTIPIQEVVPGILVQGPIPELTVKVPTCTGSSIGGHRSDAGEHTRCRVVGRVDQ